MAIIALLYAVFVWLVFFQLKWLRWGRFTGTVPFLSVCLSVRSLLAFSVILRQRDVWL